MDYWPAIDLMRQLAGELGLPVPTTIVTDDVTATQLLAALNSAGNELNAYYPWEQFRREFVLHPQLGVGAYPLPGGWKYFLDQTAWDRTNHWPLLGPKSAAEWAWLKGGLIASFPRQRYRVYNNMFQLWPIPESPQTVFELTLEYVTGFWVHSALSAGGTSDPSQEPNSAMVKADGDVVWYDPWLAMKYTKLKWLQLKNFPSEAAQADFLRVFEALKGKDTGAQVLSLVPLRTPFFIGPWSIPDGNWNV